MARRIADTPTLEGEDAFNFIIEMNKGPTKKDKELRKKIDNLKRFVPF